MIGLSLAMLDEPDLARAGDRFRRLQERFPLAACELQAETALFAAALAVDSPAAVAVGRSLRATVKVLGLHLPFIDLHPGSAQPRIAAASLETLREALGTAAEIGADYAVCHVRGTGPERWREVLEMLGGEARQAGIRLCLENADDLRRMSEVVALAEAAEIAVCLDVGHLYERIYEDPGWSVPRRVAALLQDRLLPGFRPWPGNLPAGECGGLGQALTGNLSRLGCVHLHDHDGRGAHRPLGRGKIPWGQLAARAPLLKELPVILEADYRDGGAEGVERDLSRLAELLATEGE